MEEVRGKVFIEIMVNCPHCNAVDDMFYDLRDHLEEDHRAANIDVEVECSECNVKYIVTDIDF